MLENTFTEHQAQLIASFPFPANATTVERLFNTPLEAEEDLVLYLSIANGLYRAGHPVVKDQEYDNVRQQLAELNPEHDYLHEVEPEMVVEGKMITLPQKMLSTNKAYSFSEIKKWVGRLLKGADEIGVPHHELVIRITPKLDGFAAYDDGEKLYTRGNGVRGQDISQAFARGMQVAKNSGRGLGPGEIVIQKTYFDEILSRKFENSRNVQSAIIAIKAIDMDAQKAIDDGAAVFYPFSQLENWEGSVDDLLANFEDLLEKMWNVVDFDVDGLVVETTNKALKSHLGATRSFHRWQIAFKINDEFAEVPVLSVTPQTSRTGRVSPVAELEPTKLSGATLSRATVHHYNMVKTKGIGPGAIVKLVRSGLVIPNIEDVITESSPQLPSNCPSCDAHLLWESDHLICPNKSDCPAQTENTLVHFFKTLGNVDGFGPKVVETLVEHEIKHIHQIYALDLATLISFGFGEKTSQNLIDQLKASREIEIEDWRFLAAFGVSRLADGNCEKLLQHHSLPSLFDLPVEGMVRIDGFAQLSAEAIVEGLGNISEEFFKIYGLRFNLTTTPKVDELNAIDSPIAGKQIVFTGSMQMGSRDDMSKEAKALGATVGKSVSGKTDYLVTGERVGEKKINGAKDKGVEVLTEKAYREMLGQ